MKKFLKVVLCVAVLASGASTVNAQGLGGLLNKGKAIVKKGEKVAKDGKEAVGQILGSDNSSSNNAASPDAMMPNVSQTISSSGIVVSNPVRSFIEIDPVGLFGVSTSEDYGDAYLVMRVKNLTPKSVTSFGSSVQNQKMIAVDNNGKVYNIDASGTYSYDTPEGLMIRIILNEPGLMFPHIKKNVNMMQQVKFGVLSDAQHQGNVVLSNVPIFWDQDPE